MEENLQILQDDTVKFQSNEHLGYLIKIICEIKPQAQS